MTVETKRPIALAAGGTGGHLFPAQALAAELARRGHRLVLLTDPRGQNYAQSFPHAEILTVPSATFADRGLIGKAFALATLARGAMSAYRILARLKPSVVIGFGGYPSLPTMVAAGQRGMTTLIHEQNAVLGRVNRFVAPRVTAIAASFAQMERVPAALKGRVIVTGNPVRDQISALSEQGYESPQEGKPLRLLVFGGSQGARVFSQLVPAAIGLLPEALRARLLVEQQCRPEDLEGAKAQYAALGLHAELQPFFTNMGERIVRASLVIARAGASTVAELTALGRPALFVPYPFAMDDHQSANSRLLEQAGAAFHVPEKGLTAQGMADLLTKILRNPQALSQKAAAAQRIGRPQATAALARVAEGLAQGVSIAALIEATL